MTNTLDHSFAVLLTSSSFKHFHKHQTQTCRHAQRMGPLSAPLRSRICFGAEDHATPPFRPTPTVRPPARTDTARQPDRPHDRPIAHLLAARPPARLLVRPPDWPPARPTRVRPIVRPPARSTNRPTARSRQSPGRPTHRPCYRPTAQPPDRPPRSAARPPPPDGPHIRPPDRRPADGVLALAWPSRRGPVRSTSAGLGPPELGPEHRRQSSTV